jgi:hypothetical protein
MRLIWIGAAALVALGALWFFSEFERVPDKVWIPASGEARLRPFLAAERFAERMGMRAKELRSLPELDALPTRGVLILPAPRDSLEPRRAAALLAWVERGGNLIVEAEPAARKDPLLDLLGLARKAQGKPRPEPFVAELANGRRFVVAFTSGPLLSGPVHKARLTVGDQDGWRMVAFSRGKGLVTAASSLDFARNAFVGQNDHAGLLWTALSPSPEMRHELRVFMRPHKLSLADFLATHAGPALAGGALLLALWLWRIAPRFGPLVPDAPPARRRLLDHLRASGRYFWARGRRARLLAAAREAALRRVARVHPDFAVAPERERAARLARLAGVPEAEAAQFVAPPPALLRGSAFIDSVRVAQRIHAALDKGRT